MRLTEKMKGEYLKNKGFRCPFCKRGAIEPTTFPDRIDDGMRVKMRCIICKETWHDYYQLIQVND